MPNTTAGKTRLSDSLVGYGFLTAPSPSDLFCCCRCAKGQQCQFSGYAVLLQPDCLVGAGLPVVVGAVRDLWSGSLLGFRVDPKETLLLKVCRSRGCTRLVGFPNTDNRITDLQVTVPPAAMVAFLAVVHISCPLRNQICGDP